MFSGIIATFKTLQRVCGEDLREREKDIAGWEIRGVDNWIPLCLCVLLLVRVGSALISATVTVVCWATYCGLS